MNVSRRTLLGAILTGAATGAVGWPRRVFASLRSVQGAVGALIVVQTGTPLDGRFLLGVKAVARDLGWPQPTACSLKRGPRLDVQQTRHFFRSNDGGRAAGLMDDADYVLFSALARDAGARLLSEERLGQRHGAGLVSFVIDL